MEFCSVSECLLLCGAEFEKETLGGNAGSSAEWCSLSECLLLCGAELKKKTLCGNACSSAECCSVLACVLLCGVELKKKHLAGMLAPLRNGVQYRSACCSAEQNKTLGGNAGSSAECSSAEWCSLSECFASLRSVVQHRSRIKKNTWRERLLFCGVLFSADMRASLRRSINQSSNS